jgi:signal transduction histidine kinase
VTPPVPNASIVFVKLLGIVFAAEVVVMLLLPAILPPIDPWLEALADSCLLTLICAPLLWWVIIGPLGRAADAERMAVLAQVAAGVAHEIRNPLTSIKMLVQANREARASHELLQEDLRIIEDEVRRMENSIQTFFDFARPPKPKPRPIDLRSVVDRTYVLVEAQAIKQVVQLRFDSPENAVMVHADPDQMQQLLLNLAINALQAMPGGGKVTFELQTSRSNHVVLEVQDTGTGISPEVFSRLFQPFVTNKETGVGIGLVICRRIAEDHGGRLTAQNRSEGGASFTLVLPSGAELVDPSELRSDSCEPSEA